jgi:DNA-binding SARP family transcriptional activator
MTQPVVPTSKGPEAVRVKLLGTFTVSVGSRTTRQEEWRLKKAASLVKFLALAPGHRTHRERVMDLLWPDSRKKAASNNLRQVPYAARRVLDPPRILPNATWVSRANSSSCAQTGSCGWTRKPSRWRRVP